MYSSEQKQGYFTGIAEFVKQLMKISIEDKLSQ